MFNLKSSKNKSIDIVEDLKGDITDIKGEVTIDIVEDLKGDITDIKGEYYVCI